MRNFVLLVSLASVLLGSCSGDTNDTAASSGNSIDMNEATARAQANAVKPRPGQYRVTLEVLDVDMPGAPASAGDMMKQMMGGQSHQYCLRPGDVDRGFEAMARQSQKGDNCSFQRFDISGGEFDAQMTCSNPGQGAMTMTMKGKGRPTQSEMDMTMKGNLAGMGDSTIHMKSTHTRIGDCN